MKRQTTKFSAGAERHADRPDGYGRFYSAFNRLTIHGERDEAKRLFVLQYTAGRTASLKEMSRKEYTDLCIAIEGMNGTKDELKRHRSIALKLMQELEVDTTDWAQINDFCRHTRIAGKAFGRLSIDDLAELAVKLRSIKRKGWTREQQPSTAEPTAYLINLAVAGKA